MTIANHIGVKTIGVPKTQRGMPGFVKNIRDALESGKQIRFNGLTTVSVDQTGPAWKMLRELGGYYDSTGSLKKQKGVVRIRIPKGESGIRGFIGNMKKALTTGSRVDLIGRGDTKGRRDSDQTILARRIMNDKPRAERGDPKGILRVVPKLDYHDWHGRVGLMQ